MITVTSVEARGKLGELLDNAQREPVVITRDGYPAAYLISPQQMKELQEGRANAEHSKPYSWTAVNVQTWNDFDARFGAFADEHSLL